MILCSAQNEIKDIKGVHFGAVLAIRGPLGHGGPHSKFCESGCAPIILVTNLRNFRRLRKYINIVRIVNETYIYKNNMF